MTVNEIKSEYCVLTSKWHSEILSARCVKYPDITIKTVKDISSVSKFNGLWNDVVLNSSKATIYQTYEWLYNWWNCFAADHQNSLHILLISSSGKLVGIAPFFIQGYSFGGFKIYQQLKLLGGGLNSGVSHSNAVEEYGVSDYLDIIVLDGYEEKIADAIVSYLHEFRYFFNEIDFQNVSEDSFIFNWLLPQLRTKNFSFGVTKTDVCPRLNVPCSLDNYLRSLKAGTRRKFRQIQKQTEKYSHTEIKNVSVVNFLSSFQTLKHLHQRRWNELGYLGLFSDTRFEKFIIRVSESFLNKGWLWFKELKHNDKIIAARLVYKFKNQFYDYLSGFDNKQVTASLRPGITLIFLMITDAISNNFKTVDFLRGAEEYKFEFSSSVCNNHRIAILHSVSAFGLRRRLFYMSRVRMKLMLRIKSEGTIINLHIDKHGKMKFLYAYLRFCYNRLKLFNTKHKIKKYSAIRLPESNAKNNIPEHINSKKKNYSSPKIEEVEVHS